MRRQDALRLVEVALEEEPGTLTEDTELAPLANWDSMGVLVLLSKFSESLNVVLAPERLVACRTAGDLLGLIQDHLE